MSRLRVESFSISLDGHGVGPDQDLNNPLGQDGKLVHDTRGENATHVIFEKA